MTVLLLGGTTEAGALAQALADAGIAAIYSYAGRTDAPRSQPLRTRVGGFGGAGGLADFIRMNGVSHVIDATHPFAATISANAIAACGQTGTPLAAFERPAWQPEPGDGWTRVADIPAAASALPEEPARVFLAIGKQHVGAFATRPQHHYLLRFVDTPQGALPLPDAHVIVARGPFAAADDLALMQAHRITHLVAKNAGGAGGAAKIAAARALRLPVILIDRPALPPRMVLDSVESVMGWLHHTPPALRGV
ncbi:MAG: cobalt-precorrin-6A reductase [Paracoccaceae bacterium]